MSTYDRDWMVRAICREYDPEMFAPLPRDKWLRQRAIDVCGLCPVLAECRAYASRIGATYGVWGGEFINDPSRFHTDSGGGYKLQPHGTLAAYRRHYRRGEKPCTACKSAFNEGYKTKPSVIARGAR